MGIAFCVSSEKGCQFLCQVWNRVSIFAPGLKKGIDFCARSEIWCQFSRQILNRVRSVPCFCPKYGEGFPRVIKLASLWIIQEVNTDGDTALNKDEFASFFKTISTRKEIVNLMKQYSSNGAHMTVEDFQSFLVKEQEASWPTDWPTDRSID